MKLKESDCKNPACRPGTAKGTIIQVGKKTKRGIFAHPVFGKNIKKDSVVIFGGVVRPSGKHASGIAVMDIRTGAIKILYGNYRYREIPGMQNAIKPKTNAERRKPYINNSALANR